MTAETQVEPRAQQQPVIYFFTGTDTEVGKTYCAALWVKMRCQSGRRVGVYKPVASGCRREQGRWVADDAVQLWEAAGRPRPLDAVCPQTFLHPLAPPSAAQAEGRSVDEPLILEGARRWLDPQSNRQSQQAEDQPGRQSRDQRPGASQAQPSTGGEKTASDSTAATDPSIAIDELVVEGAGGLFSPLSDSWLNIDLLIRLRHGPFQVRTVLVAADRLGIQHQVIATCRAAAAEKCPIDAIWINRLPKSAVDPTLSDSNRQYIGRHVPVPLVGSAEELSAIW